MLRWFRGHASGIATMALVALAALGATALTPHLDDCHDSACLTMLVEHDANAHQFAAPETADEGQPFHCLVCHWTRSLRPQITSKLLPESAVQARTRVQLDVLPVAHDAQVAQPPLRSPPVASAHA
jgi:hypothetical protein